MKSSIQIKKIAREVIKIEQQQIENLVDRIDEDFIKAIKLISSSNGRLIVAGVGKSANISSKLVATFNSTGQPAIFLHAADAVHGDLGNVQEGDIVLCLSKSGNTNEIKSLISNIKILGNKIISICGNPSSYLAQNSDVYIDASVSEEACPHDLAPTSSTTVQLVLGDALAICLLEYKGFTKEGAYLYSFSFLLYQQQEYYFLPDKKLHILHNQYMMSSQLINSKNDLFLSHVLHIKKLH